MKRKIAILIVCSILVMVGLFLWESSSLEAQARQTLYWGTQSNDVNALQQRLKQWGYYDGPVNGYYGQQTFDAVKSFQRKNGLTADGVVGPSTWGALGYNTTQKVATPKNTPVQAPKSNSGGVKGITNNNDLHLLARLVHAEAQGEPYTGQVAVAAVMLNRVHSPEFPNSISGVIYQPLAFESVANGEINKDPAEENYRAARDALNGYDPTQGCVFFWNPSKPVSKWIWSRQRILDIGNHTFAK